MTTKLHDIEFRDFDWQVTAAGDLKPVEGLPSFRNLIIRWLLTEPADVVPGITQEEIEVRRLYETPEGRASAYDPPDGDRQRACIPWDPTWGAGIKRYLSLPITPALLGELSTRIRSGLSRLDGVAEVLSVAVSGLGSQVTVAWKVATEFGTLEDSTIIRG